MKIPRRSLRDAWIWGLLLASFCGAGRAVGAENPYRVLLDDPFPNAYAPVQLSPSDYHWQGIEKLPAGTKLDWDPNSVQWSRIDDRIVLPRARVKIEIPEVDGALVSTWERTTPLRRSTRSTWFGEVMVPLASGEASQLKIWLKKGGVEVEVPLTLERNAVDGPDAFGIDHSCSPWGIELVRRAPPVAAGTAKIPTRPAILLADCRLIRSESNEGMLASLDLFLFLDGGGDELKMNGTTVKAEAPSLFRLRLFPQSQPVLFESMTGEVFELRYRIPTKLNRGFIGVGAGPYRYTFQSPTSGVETTAAVLTLYGSYQFSESVRFTAFNATVINPYVYTDTGFYFKSESVKLLDQRVLVSVMLGANLMGFKYNGDLQKTWGAPQGFEAVVSDFPAKNRSLVIGAFIYPPIEGKSYYNSWVRYGSSSIFGEMNYLSVRNQFGTDSVYVKSVGFSLGFPLARFF